MRGPDQRSGLNRRDLMRAAGAAGLVLALPAGCRLPPPAREVLTEDERAMLAALADAILPPDDAPGGAALGTVEYTERLLGAFDAAVPAVFAGGPYSGRQPFGDGLGGASTAYPENDFAVFLPLDRYAEAGWRLRLLGSSGVQGGGPNDAVVGAVEGLGPQLRRILAEALRYTPAPPEELTADQRAALLGRLDQSAIDTLMGLVSEAAFGPPEYGGNPDGAGWALVHYEGDIQPLGYSLYDVAAGAYRERPDAPVSGPDPGPDPEPLDDDAVAFIRLILTLVGGEEWT